MKQYLIDVTAYLTDGGTCTVKLKANTDNKKPIVLICDGEQIGKNYKSFSAASKCLAKIVDPWKINPDVIAVETGFGGPDDIMLDGCSEWNKALYRWEYCGEPFPDPAKYIV